MSEFVLARIPPIVRAPIFALFFWWVALVLGYRILRLTTVPIETLTKWEKGIVCAAFGVASLQYLPYALGLFGLMTPPVVRVGFALVAVLLLPDQVRVGRALWSEVRGLPYKQLNQPAFIWGAMLFLLLAIRLVHAVTIGDTGDDDGYHLSAPKRWLEAGTLSYLPSYTNTNAAMGFEMLYAIGMAVCDPIGAKLLHYCAGIILLVGIVLCARRIAGVLPGIIAVSLLLIQTPVCNFTELLSCAFVDFGACWMTIVATLLWLVWRERQTTVWLVCLALCAGFAGSIKVTAVSVAVALVPALVLDLRASKQSWLKVAKVVVTFGMLALCPLLPWLFRNWRLTGNPLYPLLPSAITTRDWTLDHAQIFARYTRYYSWAISAGSRLSEANRKEILLAAALSTVAGAAVTLWFVRKPVLRALIIGASVFALVALASTGLYFRYALPAMVWLSLVVGVVLAQRWSAKEWRLWPAAALMTIAVIVQVARDARNRTTSHLFVPDAKIALGLATFDEAYPNDPLSQTWGFINASTPKDSRILMAAFYTTFGASSFGGLGVDRQCYATDSHLQTYIRFDAWPSFVRSVERAGVSHVVISDELLLAGRHGFSFQSGRNEYPFCRRLVDQFGEKLAQFQHMQLYRLRPLPAESVDGDLLTTQASKGSPVSCDQGRPRTD